MKFTSIILATATWGACAIGPAAGADSGVSGAAGVIGRSAGFPGGMCTVLGRTDADLAIALSRQGKFIVQGLYDDRGQADAARKAMRAAGAYGTVSADAWDPPRLPYAENLINILVVDRYPSLKATGPALDEILRVLAPLGAAYFGDSSSPGGPEADWVKALASDLSSRGLKAEVLNGAGVWVKVVKPWPREIDQWTHYLHGPDGNPVARDRVVGPPKHYQWISEPLWLRSHETDSSIRTVVTAGGRLFYIEDQAPISLEGDHGVPDKWRLVARDAFNGTPLWSVPIEDWGWRAWKSHWFSNRPGDIPLNVTKRLVATEDKVYVTLGYHAPVSELDARTGKTLRTYAGTERAAEILYQGGTLVLPLLGQDGVRVTAVDAAGGRRLWTTSTAYKGTTTDYVKWTGMRGGVKPAPLDPTVNLATDGRVVALIDDTDIVCLDFKTGKEKWRSPFQPAEGNAKAGGINATALWNGAVIVADGVVLYASPGKLAAFSAETGKTLWSQPKKYLGHLWYEWKDVFVIDGRVWTWSAETNTGPLAEGKGKKERSTWPVSANGYDLHTGKLTKQVPLGAIFKANHHHRCYRDKATVRYILASRRGTEFVDLEQGRHVVDNWVRGPCHVGMMPANGLQYAPPHPCQCYIDEKLTGMNALAPEIPAASAPRKLDETGRLERGPAFGQAGGGEAGAEDWPAFRHDGQRSGAATTPVPSALRLLWKQNLGGRLAPPVVAGGRLFIPQTDAHHLLALNASDGAKVWEFAAGGRIDSPPTYVRGTLIFGSTDGWTYCVRASDGQLAWRYRAGPEDRRIGAFGQLESAWPVHGSVLVRDGVAYFAAGRSSHLDGGIRLCGLDAATGQVRCRTRLEGPSYTVDNITENYRLPMGALADILLESDSLIYMRDVAFNAKLEPQKIAPAKETFRVVTKAGFLDDSYFKRTPWTTTTGQGDFARLIVFDDRSAYHLRMFDTLRGLDPTVFFTPGKQGYLLFATDRRSGKEIWSGRIPIRGTAMVAAAGLLFLAGPPDTVDPKDPLEAFEGRKGGLLAVIDGATGKGLSQYALPSPPVFNGSAAAGGRLYVALQDGSLACFGQ